MNNWDGEYIYDQINWNETREYVKRDNNPKTESRKELTVTNGFSTLGENPTDYLIYEKNILKTSAFDYVGKDIILQA